MAAAAACVTAIGPSESGKSALLRRLYTSRAPRVITLEVVDETRDDKARRAYGFAEVRDTLREFVAKDVKRWHLVAHLSREDAERLFALMLPDEHRRGTASYSRAVGGVVIACGEMLKYAPNGLADDSFVKAAYLRGRHYDLSVHAATQHAPDVDPCVRMNAERLVFLRASDELALNAIRRASSKFVSEIVADLPRWHSATYFRASGLAYIADDKDAVYRIVNYRGVELYPAASESARSSAVPHSNGSRRLVGMSRGGVSG